MNIEIILNVFIAMFIYNLVLKAMGITLMKYFLDGNDYVKKEKESFKEKLKNKLEEDSK